MRLTLDIYEHGCRLAVVVLDSNEDIPPDMLSWIKAHVDAQRADDDPKPPYCPKHPNA